jgi:hypothetical protein
VEHYTEMVSAAAALYANVNIGCNILYQSECNALQSGFGGLVVSMLASGTQDRGFFSGVKNPKHAFLRKGSKAVGPVS